MPTRNQIELAALLGLSSTCALSMGILAYLRLTPGADGKPRPRISLKDSTIGQLINPSTSQNNKGNDSSSPSPASS